MGLNSDVANERLEEFLEAWPVNSLRLMTVQQYANLDDHNAYCYWLEYRSREIGEIGGMPLTKFGLWKWKNRSEFENFQSDTTYAWNRKYGQSRTEAFKNIISLVADIAEAAIQGDWHAIQSIDFHAVAKWKIAFIYSGKRLVPIYTREGLLKVAAGLGKTFRENAPVVELQEYIAGEKPADQDMFDYAQNIWEHFVKGKPFRNYFIIGTTYKKTSGEDSKDIFPEMLTSNSVAIGFLRSHDLTVLAGKSNEEIDQFIATNSGEEEIPVSRLQSYFRILMRLKPGDIIAVKSQVSHGMVTIIAYAVVVERNGKVYEYHPDQLGHHINVEFVELGINRQSNLNYSGVLQHVSSEKLDHLKAIFGPFLQVDNIAVSTEEDNSASDDGRMKGEDSYERGPIAARMVRQLHNIIQNSFIKQLRATFPNDDIDLEYENRIDILRKSKKERWLYEVKPYENVIYCLRTATGQLLEYAFRFPDPERETHLVIVGPGEIKPEAMGYLDHFKESIKLSLTYEQHIAPTRQD